MAPKKIPKKKTRFGTERYTISKIFAIIVFLVAIVVMIGWIYDISLLKSILPVWVSMKFSTAISFLFSAVILYFFANAQEKKRRVSSSLLLLSAAVILFFMGTLFVSTLFGVSSGVETLFIQEESGSLHTTQPGLPSVPTMFNFIIISLLALVILLKPHSWKFLLSFGSKTIFIIAATALLGYILNIPLLYYLIPDVNTPMAIHTSILFILLSMWFYLTGVHESFLENSLFS